MFLVAKCFNKLPILLSAAIALISLAGCGAAGEITPSTGSPGTLLTAAPVPAAPDSTFGALPVDQLQPWETLDENGAAVAVETASGTRSGSAVNGASEFMPGIDYHVIGGDCSDFSEALRVGSGAVANEELSFAMYRLNLAGVQPGVVTVDANLRPRPDSTPSSYWVCLSEYGSGCWEWYGPTTDAAIRISTSFASDYLSGLGNLFVGVVAYDGSAIDIVGVGANPRDAGDVTAPPRPLGIAAASIAGGMELTWLAVPLPDIAGYRVYYHDAPFTELTTPGLQQVPFLEGLPRHILNVTQTNFVRVTAVDISGNESPPSDLVSAGPLAGAPATVITTVSAPGGNNGEILGVTVTTSIPGALFDFDVDGDGIFDLLDLPSGAANLDTSRSGVIRPLARAHDAGGTMVALGGVSAVISSNIRPVADGYASPAYGEAPHAVTFTGQGFDDDGVIVQYAWDFNGDGTYDWTSASTPNPPVQNYTIAGTYNTKFRVTDDQGSIDIDTVTITVYDPADPPVNIPPVAVLSANRTRILIGEATASSVWFDAAASVDPEGGALNYEFDCLGDGAFVDYGATDFVQYDYNTPGVYLARVRVTDDGGATATDSMVVSVYQFDGNQVDTTLQVGQYSSLAVIVGNPAIAYYDQLNDDLYYVRANDSSGISWGTPVLVDGPGTDSGKFCSLSETGGWPAISYFNATAGTLMFCKASNAWGTAWATPYTVSLGLVSDAYCTMRDVDGRAAICYYYSPGNNLYYTRSTTATGSSWGAPVLVDSNGGMYNDMEIVNGRPAISYNGGSSLKYSIADDALGSTWPPMQITVDSNGPTGLYTSLAVVDENPAISYKYDPFDDLMYVRATGPDGLTWGTPVAAVTYHVAGDYSSLAVIFGVPAIAYNEGSYDLRFVSALDSTGTTWDDPLYVDRTSTGHDCSMVELATGLPGISYYQDYADDLYYAHVRLD